MILSESEVKIYNQYKKEQIIEKCKIHGLPLHIQSTAVLFWSKFPSFPIDAAISLACKSNDSLAVDEDDHALADAIDYEFSQPSPYLRMYGYIVILQERELVELDADLLWTQSVRNMEKLLTMDIDYDVNEMALAAIELPVETLEIKDVNIEKVKELKERIKEVKPLNENLLHDVLMKTSEREFM